MTTLHEIRALVANELTAVDQTILQELQSNIPLIANIGQHLVNSGGKRLRPLLVLLAARACGYTGEHHIRLAAIIEFIHTATLLHDDVVDHSNLRRGLKTANAVWGNSASVLVGDFIYSRCFQMMTALDSMPVMQVLANATNTIAQGEVLQLQNSHNPELTEQDYFAIIHHKTAVLFATATELAGIITGVAANVVNALKNYGLALGIAFQLIDDKLDYSASASDLGKNIGDDLAEGKLTLPLIEAMRRSSPEQAALMKDAIRSGDLSKLELIKDTLIATNAIAYSEQQAHSYIDKALSELTALPSSPYRTALTNLAHFALTRSY